MPASPISPPAFFRTVCSSTVAWKSYPDFQSSAISALPVRAVNQNSGGRMMYDQQLVGGGVVLCSAPWAPHQPLSSSNLKRKHNYFPCSVFDCMFYLCFRVHTLLLMRFGLNYFWFKLRFCKCPLSLNELLSTPPPAARNWDCNSHCPLNL